LMYSFYNLHPTTAFQQQLITRQPMVAIR